ncbi:MAG: hypothetical protein P9L99_11500 [Candidatus Lernaella stagnicola]|nr:hypothetical protein [Candidatus Lernaella stagnicola]
MKRKWLLVLLAFMMILTFAAIGCGDDDDDDDDNDDSTIPPGGDDDDNDDDTAGDDDDDDDDDDNDDDDNDTTPDDPDTEFSSLFCTLPDPEEIGEGLLIGGGSAGDTIAVYVYEEAYGADPCEPIENAAVIAGGTEYTTDADGFVEVDLTKAATMVTAGKNDFMSWTYKADAAVMYFRLRPETYTHPRSLSASDEFYVDATPLELTNPNSLAGLITQPIYIGAGFGGFSRQQLFSTDFGLVFTDEDYHVDITLPDAADAAYYLPLPENIYLPELDLNLLGIAISMNDHSFYRFPYLATTNETPVAGVLLDCDLGSVLTLETLTEIVQGIINGDDVLEIVMGLLPAFLSDGLTVPYAGALPDWDTEGVPGMEMLPVDVAKDSFEVTIANPDAGADYIGLLAAEIPNRLVAPLDFAIADEGVMTLSYADIPDADYLLGAIKTDLLASEFVTSKMTIAAKYAPFSDSWADGVEIAQSDFLPYFDEAATSYNSMTEEVTWALESKADVDAYFVAVFFDSDLYESAFALLPPTASSFRVPSQFSPIGSVNDIVIVMAIDLPDGVDIDEWNPVEFWSNNLSAISVWTHPTLPEIISLLFDAS